MSAPGSFAETVSRQGLMARWQQPESDPVASPALAAAVSSLTAAIAAKQDLSTAATDVEVAAIQATLTASIAGVQTALNAAVAGGATDAELAAAVSAITAAMATDAEVAALLSPISAAISALQASVQSVESAQAALEASAAATELFDIYAGKGTAALATADSGQAWEAFGSVPLTIIADKLANVMTGATTKGGYAQATLDEPVTRIGGTFTFGSYSAPLTGAVALIVPLTDYASEYPTLADFGMHWVTTPTYHHFSVVEGDVFDYLYTDFYDVALTADGVTEHTVDIFRNGDTVYIFLPDGTLRTLTDPRIESLTGVYPTLEVFASNPSTGAHGAFTDSWADSRTFPVPA